jgi:LuxR family maltose regulon positive regulatory protein
LPDLTLVRSKLLVPSPAGLLHRPRVCASIERGLDRRLTLVSAPAGYGKTSGLIDFAQHCPLPVSWYTADERDRDVGLFVAYLAGAIGERFPGFGERTRQALADPAIDLFHDPTAVVADLVNEIVKIGEPLVVVVDGYGALDGALGVRYFVRRLLEVFPADCHLMLASRVLPEVPVTQLVARQELVGVTAADLRFEAEEIKALLRLSGREISAEQAEAIAAGSEGWITGVLLLAGALEGEEAGEALVAGKATTETYGYLAGEVFSRQPPDVQQFLVTSSVLREMSAHLCREALGLRRPGGLLGEIERRNLFVTRFGTGKGARYRYHSLFREFLHERLGRRDAARRAALHGRAGEWFEEQNEIEEAVYHYLAAEAYDRATRLMERVAMEWFTRGRVETLIQWAETLPEEARVGAPRLLVYQSKVLTDRSQNEEARQALDDAEEGLAVTGAERTLQAKIHNQRATLALGEARLDYALNEGQAAMALLEDGEVRERASALRHVGRAKVGLGRIDEGIGQLEQALKLCRETENSYDLVNVLQDLTAAMVHAGRIDRAVRYANEALAVGRRLGATVQLAGLLNSLGWLHHARGEYRQALAAYQEGLAAARAAGSPFWHACLYAGMADLHRDIGSYQRAEPLYRAAWQIAQESDPALAVYVCSAESDMRRWQREHERALGLAQRALKLARQSKLEFEERGLASVTEGAALAESGRLKLAVEKLKDAVDYLAERQAKRELARATFLLARAYLLAGEEAPARDALRRSVRLAGEIGYYQFAAAEGQHGDGLLDLCVSSELTGCSRILEMVQQLRAVSQEGLEAVGDVEKESARHLEIYALGEGRVVWDGRLVGSSEWQAAMAKELFFYILLHGPLERDVIGAVFWPDLPPKSVTSSFHNALYRVRGALGGDAIVVDDGRYRVGDIDYWFDVYEFEELVERARLLPVNELQTQDLWHRSVSLYGGDFLPEVERLWSVPRREELREEYVEALVGVGRCHEARRDFDGAVAWYRRALEVDELREDVHRRTMSCLAAAERRSEAVAQFHRCRQLLESELQLEPSQETRELYERIAAGLDIE